MRALAVAPVSELGGDARANAERVDGVEPFEAARLADCSVAVDALLGTGFSGTPHGAVADAIEALNDAGLPIVAADVPSGVDAASGVVEATAIRARATATFAAAKPGLWINPGKSHAGTVRVIDIGIPQGAPVASPTSPSSPMRELLALLPSREAGWTKFTSGHVLVAGGLAGSPARRRWPPRPPSAAGAGYVAASCVPASAQPILAQRLLEAMTRALPEDDGAHTAAGVDEVLELAQRGGALVVGPGLGRSDGAFAFARDLVARAEVAVVLDADGLNAHAGDLGALAGRTAPTRSSRRTRASSGACSRSSRPSWRPAASSTRAPRRRRRRRSWSSRATTPSWPTPAAWSPSAPVRRARWPRRAPATSSAGSSPPCSRVASSPSPRRAPACACRARGHARRPEKGVDGVIARDVVEAPPSPASV